MTIPRGIVVLLELTIEKKTVGLAKSPPPPLIPFPRDYLGVGHSGCPERSHGVQQHAGAGSD